MNEWQPVVLSNNTIETLKTLIPAYRNMLLTVLKQIIERYNLLPNYNFIDTKLNIITGSNFGNESGVKGNDVIYSWIQGRGLEALVAHAEWLEDHPQICQTISTILQDVMQTMETFRASNNEHLYFMMSPTGTALTVDQDSMPVEMKNPPLNANFSDLFYSKGLFAAATYLKNGKVATAAEAYFQNVLDDIENHKFLSDQQGFDPKNPVKPVPGKHVQGPRMIALGGIAILANKTKDLKWLDYGERFISYILDNHVNTGQQSNLKPFDFWEAVNDSGAPWLDDGALLSDTGHSLEFIGLALKVIFEMEAQAAEKYAAVIARCKSLFPEIFVHNFHLSFNPEVGGICKSLNLVNRKPINSDMPWWSLPETIRAGVELLKFCPKHPKTQDICDIVGKCSNGFMTTFVNPSVHLMAYQTVDIHGEPVDTVPATPDADPGYHTGISIIDALTILKDL